MRIRNIEEVTPRRVYAIETSTHTFVADGLYHHNCIGCNIYGNGKYAEYSVWYINKYGLESWEEKVSQKHSIKKYKVFELEEITAEYKNKLDKLLEKWEKENLTKKM